MNCRFIVIAVLTGMITIEAAAQKTVATPIRVLLLSGQNNHDWRETTPKLRAILESGGRFVVTVTDHPETSNAETLAKCDVLLSNWNTFGKPAVAEWPEDLRKAFLDFVRGGKGFVSVHAGTSSFYDWPEYQRLGGASWDLKETGHGPVHQFKVKATAVDHPVTRGMADFLITDELWHRAGLQLGANILATAFSGLDKKGSGRDEPVVLVTELGAGRGFNLLLGHDIHAMEAPGFQELLRRGTEWAATGSVAAAGAAR